MWWRHKRDQKFAWKLPEIWLISPKARKLFRSIVQYILLLLIILILILWLGAEYQDFRARREPDTLDLYETERVCGIDGTNATTTSYENTTYVPSESFVAHCGDCGQCSTPHDIRIYDETKNTLFETTVNCAKRSFLWGRKTASTCMEEDVGFTDGCNHCWVENIMCSVKSCFFVCTWHALFSEVSSTSSNESDPQDLNRCTLCDEKRCGRQFVNCAGANRRRSGILSNIERDQDHEVCQYVKQSWWMDDGIQQAYERSQTTEESTPRGNLRG